MASSSENTAPPTEEPHAPPQPPNPSQVEAEEPQTLERAQELFDQGSKAIEDGDFVEAVDCLSRALEIRVVQYGELAPECASTYYKYGAALLYKYQEESDPLGGNVPKSAPNEQSVKSSTGKNDSESSKMSGSGSNVEDAASSEKVDAEEGQNSNGKDQEDGNDEIGSDDEKAGDEDDSDLDLSWKMLDIARVIVEKSQGSTLQKAKIYSALGEASLEREDIDNSLSDYFKALAILEQMVESDHRRIVELNFRICLVYELACKTDDAIPYCSRAISLCKSRIESLKNSKDVLADKDENASAAEGGSQKAPEDEIEALTGILGDLEKKLEDLEQAMTTPSSALDGIINTIAMRAAQEQKDVNAMPRAASFTSSQMATTSNGFDSSTISTAAATGSTVTDLGVVGRGVKRASIKPISAEPSLKKPALDSPSLQVDSSNNSEVVTPQNGDDSVSK